MAHNGRHLIAPSNSSMLYHPENTLTDYTVHLPEDLMLSGEYEIGLEEISFPRSWYNISDNEYVEFYSDTEGFRREYVRIGTGYYRSPEEFTKVFNKICADEASHATTTKTGEKKKRKPVRLVYNRQYNRMSLRIPLGRTLKLDRDAVRVLGFSRKGPFRSRGPNDLRVWGTGPPNLHRNLRTLQVYCDLVTPHRVGDAVLPFLRAVQVPTEYSTFIVTKTYTNIHYYPVARHSGSSIRVYIRDEAGLPVPFEYGKVIVSLHLRRHDASSETSDIMKRFILPSDSSASYFRGNTTANFVTKLPVEESLVGECEVALEEIQYPRTWYNVVEDEVWCLYAQGGTKLKCVIKPGAYVTGRRVMAAFLKAFRGKGFGHLPTFSFDQRGDRSRMVLPINSTLSFSDSAKLLSGFTQSRSEYIGGTMFTDPYEAERAPDFSGGVHSLYVYCDLVAPHIVGDVSVPLLRIVPARGLNGEVVTKSYDEPQYHPLLCKTFSTVEIDIRDDTGRHLPFQSGKVVVTLHVRSRRGDSL